MPTYIIIMLIEASSLIFIKLNAFKQIIFKIYFNQIFKQENLLWQTLYLISRKINNFKTPLKLGWINELKILFR